MSPWNTRTWSASTPSHSLTIWANTVSWPCPWRMRADMQRDRAVLRDADFHPFGLIAGALAMQRKPDAAAQAAALALRTARWKAIPIGKRESPVEHLFEFSAIIDEAARVLYGIAEEGTRLRRRISTGSMPISRAALSTRRSVTKLASGLAVPR